MRPLVVAKKLWTGRGDTQNAYFCCRVAPDDEPDVPTSHANYGVTRSAV